MLRIFTIAVLLIMSSITGVLGQQVGDSTDTSPGDTIPSIRAVDVPLDTHSLLPDSISVGQDSLSLDTSAMQHASDSTLQDSIAVQVDAFEPVPSDSLSSAEEAQGDSARLGLSGWMRKHKLYVGAYVSPELNFVRIGKFPSVYSEYDGGTKGRFSAAVVVGYELLEQLQLEVGVGYGMKSLRSTRTGTNEAVLNDSLFGIASSTQVQFDMSMQELQLPLSMKWEVWKDRLSINAGYEVQYQFNRMTTIEYRIEGQVVQSEQVLLPNQLNASPTLGVEYRHALENSVLLRVEPIVKPYARYFDLGTRRGQLLSFGLKLGATF